VATASGQAALHLTIATAEGAGGISWRLAQSTGGSHNLFTHTLPRFGITTTLVDRAIPTASPRPSPKKRASFSRKRWAIPGLEVLDIAAVAAVAHKHALPLAIDSTFATPYLCRPIEHGRRHRHAFRHQVSRRPRHRHRPASVVDGGRFDWAASVKFPTMTEPYAGYHGIAFAEEFGPAAFIMRARPRACVTSAPA